MSTVYLDRSGNELSLEGGCLVIRNGSGRKTVPLALLERLVIAARTRCDSTVLNRLAAQGIAVVFLDTHRSRLRSQLFGSGHQDASIRLAQYCAVQDPGWRLAWARALVAAKLRRQHRWLMQMAQKHPATAHPLREAAHKLQTLSQTVAEAESLAQLRGYEGSAGQCFFQVYRLLFPAGLEFTARRRRPPPDPVNTVLSLGYTLLHARAVQTAWAAGLDPLLGFYHEPFWGRESLACDLIEPWRPCIDAWTWHWFQRRWLEAGHFSRKGEACRLGKSGRERFFAAFENQVRPVQRALRHQVRALVRTLKAKEVSLP